MFCLVEFMTDYRLLEDGICAALYIEKLLLFMLVSLI